MTTHFLIFGSVKTRAALSFSGDWNRIVDDDLAEGPVREWRESTAIVPTANRQIPADANGWSVLPMSLRSTLVVSSECADRIRPLGAGAAQLLPCSWFALGACLLHPLRQWGALDYDASDVDLVPNTKVVARRRALVVRGSGAAPSVYRIPEMRGSGVVVSTDIFEVLLSMGGAQELGATPVSSVGQ